MSKIKLLEELAQNVIDKKKVSIGVWNKVFPKIRAGRPSGGLAADAQAGSFDSAQQLKSAIFGDRYCVSLHELQRPGSTELGFMLRLHNGHKTTHPDVVTSAYVETDVDGFSGNEAEALLLATLCIMVVEACADCA